MGEARASADGVTRGIKVVLGLAVLVLLVPLVGHFWPMRSQPIAGVGGRQPISVASRTLTVNDGKRPWTTAWMQQGIPAPLIAPGEVPWIVADPQHPTRTWWFWPRWIHGALWMGTLQHQVIQWQPVQIGQSPLSSWPSPVRHMVEWAHSLETGQGSIPTNRVEPPGAFVADMGTVTAVTGWEASMEPTPRTMVLTGGLVQNHRHGLRLITLWHWSHADGWICTLIVLTPEPMSSLPQPTWAMQKTRLPGWVSVTRNSDHDSRIG